MRAWSTIEWVAFAAGALVAYETVRHLIVRTVRRAAERRVSRYLLHRRVRLDRYKFANRFYVRAEMLDDPPLHEAIAEEARARGTGVERILSEVERYIDEIVPAFSFVSYYQLARRLARFATDLVYDVSADRGSMLRVANALGENDVPVYVSNHRSNADFVLLTRVLARQTAISYAVGEWARIWPLDALFRSFGGYFVRRGFKQPLYHAVLRRYVQLAARRGVTQGIFPEGGLSRDGLLRPPKVGLLRSLAMLLADTDFRRDVVICPIGVNYDHVLEDTALLRERDGAPAPSAADRLRSLVGLVWRGPAFLVDNAVRLLTGRFRRFGVAAIAFGEPISLRKLLESEGRTTADDDWARGLGPRVIEAIGRVVPVTPVSATCLALARALPAGGPESSISRESLKTALQDLLERLEQAGAPVARVPRMRALRTQRARLEGERPVRSAELVDLEDDLLRGDEAEQMMDIALEILTRRRVVRSRGSALEVPRDRRPIVDYYANSLAHHLRRLPPLPPG